MAIIRSPFKSNKLETDPLTFGLREKVIKDSIKELISDKSILITGTRGIGKSSLAYQLQNVLRGNKVLLQRCSIEISIPYYITVSYTCQKSDTIDTIFDFVIHDLYKKTAMYAKKHINKAKFELDFQVFFTKLKVECESPNRITTIGDLFVEAIRRIMEDADDVHINILLDELDQLDNSQNIAHFIKSVSEILNSHCITALSFIMVGQTSFTETLFAQQPAVFRLVKQFDLKPLDDMNSRYILDCALASVSETTVHLASQAEDFLLKLCCGYPYYLHTLGDEALSDTLSNTDVIPDEIEILKNNVLRGLRSAISGFEERFETIIRGLSEKELCLVSYMAEKTTLDIPIVFSCKTALEVLASCSDSSDIDNMSVIKGLCKQQIFTVVKEAPGISQINERSSFRFTEELFRIYLSWSGKNIEMFSSDVFGVMS